jgi:DNA-binding NarL/FixJ family response regulator
LAKRGIRVTRCAEQAECLDLLGRRRWHFLVLDALDQIHGTIRLFKQSYPAVPVLVLVKRGDTATAVQAMKAGAADCIETPIATDRLRDIVDALDAWVRHHSQDSRVDLTPVEQTILRHILNGYTNRQIADLLSRSPRTIEVHRRHIMAKLNAPNFVELVKQALRAGLVEPIGTGRPWEREDTPSLPYTHPRIQCQSGAAAQES